MDANHQPHFDPVPVTIAILDEDTNHYSQGLFLDDRLGEFCGLSVSGVDAAGEPIARQFHSAKELAWIEVTGPDPADDTRPTYWPFNSPVTPWHGVCHPAVDDCKGFTQLRDTSEWHAQLMLPLEGVPGTSQNLELIAWVSQDRVSCAEAPDRWVALRNYAHLAFAPAALPRFDDGWLYGDLHYHSQSTDNEGESGYAYRAVATTLAAMGVDFVFATDHASDSEQIVDADISFDPETRRGLRDLSQPRWDAAESYLHGPGGANQEGAVFAAGHANVPRVFLGAEVDVVPEVPTKPTWISLQDPGWMVPYGNGLVWNMIGHDGICAGERLDAFFACPTMNMIEPFVDVGGQTAYMVKDLQGINSPYVGRQHVLYLPRFRDQPGALVASRTTAYGGASRHLLEDHGVLDEISANSGVAFLAHPLAAGGGDIGPGMLPYSQYQYEKIFAHPALVGLQLWNEDSRVESSAGEFGQTGYSYLEGPSLLDWDGNDGSVHPGFEHRGFTLRPVDSVGSWTWTKASSPASKLHHGTAQWDRLLRWGLDLARTLPIGWLEPGEPRRLLMAGGSDAHGDFNYRREGYMTGISKTTDTAIAKVRNLVQVGAPRGPCGADGKCYARDPNEPGHPQDQVAEALAEGHFSVTDGPALRIVVDRNRNHRIDDADYPMGSTVELFPGEQLPLLVEAISTREFGELAKIDLYVGVDAAPLSVCTGTSCSTPAEVRARTFAPVDHGVRGEHTDNGSNTTVLDTPATDCGPGLCQMADGYWLPASPAARDKLSATPLDLQLAPGEQPSLHRLAGVYEVSLSLDDFPVGGIDPRPTRIYVRAFAKTTAPCTAATPDGKFHADCADRYAYTNPIWTLRKPLSPGDECPFTDRSLDRDLDGVPDICDQFPDQPTGGAWTRVFGGPDLDYTTATVIDAANNVYVAGGIRSSGRIEGATGGGGTFTASGDDALVLKYSPTGQLLGKLQLTGFGLQVVSDLAVRGDKLYLVGTSQGATTVGTTSWTSDSRDPFVARVRLGDLGVEAINRIAGAGPADGRKVAIGSGGQLAIVGDYSGVLWSLQPTTAAEGLSDCFVAWFNESTLQLQSLQRARGTGGCAARGVTVDGAGRATAAFEYDGAIAISSAPVIGRTTTGTDLAVVRYANLAGGVAPTWATYVGSLAALKFGGGDAWGTALAGSADGSVYLAGSYTGNLTVIGTTWTTGQTIVQHWSGGTDGFIVHLDPSGQLLPTPLGALSGPGAETFSGLAVDASGQLVVIGKFTSAAANLGAAALTRASSVEDYLLAWVAPNGDLTRVRQMTASSLVGLAGVATTPLGDRAAIGWTFTGSARFDDRRTVTSASATTADGAVTMIPGP